MVYDMLGNFIQNMVCGILTMDCPLPRYSYKGRSTSEVWKLNEYIRDRDISVPGNRNAEYPDVVFFAGNENRE